MTCGGGVAGNARNAKAAIAHAAESVALAEPDAAPSHIDGFAVERLKERHAWLKVPEALEGEEADKFVTKRLASLAPTALAEVEYRLKLGDSEERYEAAIQVLDRTGFGKTDKANGPTSPIIVINAGGGFAPPWAQKGSKVEVVDAETLPEGVKP